MQNITTNHAIANTNSLNRKIANARGGWEEGEAGTLLSSLSPSHHPPRDFFFRLSPVSPRHKVLIGIATFVTD